jgi:hypothetical protein
MKSIITLSAVAVLAAFALVGCNQKTPSNPDDAQSTNSSTGDTNVTISAVTNLPDTNSLHDMETNTPENTNAPDVNTNMPPSTNP